MYKLRGILLGIALLPVSGVADVVRPALIEISVNTSGLYRVEIRASIEALLTGINADYKNTGDAPGAEAYDALRVLSANDLSATFAPFQARFTDAIALRFDDRRVPLAVSDTIIPEPGYTKVPRISLIVLEGKVNRTANSLDWYYPASFGDNAVRVRQIDAVNERWHWSEWQWLRKDARSEIFSLTEVFSRRPAWQTVRAYLIAGFAHILPRGLDHILFISGIFLLSLQCRPLLWQVTMFTVAHTLTLGLSMANYVNLPAGVVEPLIALSIAWIGVENIRHKALHKSRLPLVFAFGLLHGMGFADALRDFGMPDDAFLTALISFNVGVESGQLAIILLAFTVLGWFRQRKYYRHVIIVPASLAITVIGLYWTVNRIVV